MCERRGRQDRPREDQGKEKVTSTLQYHKYHKYPFSYLARATEVQTVHQYGTWVHHFPFNPFPFPSLSPIPPPPHPATPFAPLLLHPSLFEIIHKIIRSSSKTQIEIQDKTIQDKYPKLFIPAGAIITATYWLYWHYWHYWHYCLFRRSDFFFSAADTKETQGRQDQDYLSTLLLLLSHTDNQQNERSSHNAPCSLPRFRHN